jgi:biotin carboxyl carrier protein
MDGKILSIEKTVGECIEEDEVLVVMEALKMEIPVVAPVTGVIAALAVKPGDLVKTDSPIAEIA